METYYIYLTTNLINGKKYIGKHKGNITDSYLGSGTNLKEDIKKFGKNNFKKDILFISKNEKENCEKEKEFIKAFNAIEDKNFYNIHEGGKGGNTIAGWSKERKQEHSELLSILRSGTNNPRYGVHLSEETKEKISKNKDTNYTKTESYKQKMSTAVRGEKNGMYGKKHTIESRNKMSINSKGKTAGSKNGMYGKSNDNAINGKKINMYDENKTLLRTFASKTAVLNYLNLKGHTKLDEAIKNKTLYKNYYWSVETK